MEGHMAHTTGHELKQAERQDSYPMKDSYEIYEDGTKVVLRVTQVWLISITWLSSSSGATVGCSTPYFK